jgi:hypothetical protein
VRRVITGVLPENLAVLAALAERLGLSLEVHTTEGRVHVLQSTQRPTRFCSAIERIYRAQRSTSPESLATDARS